ncbi:DUF7144 family membrane protein [Nocardia paucivorans]|uniref:DUF7144 family membrane protein n=1 Tax=Nocardia paucivorans TaxID=114259 RepID=UPI0002DB8F14
MTTEPKHQSSESPTTSGTHTLPRSGSSPVRQGLAFGGTIAAAALLLTVGVVNLLQGISAVVEDDIFVVGPQYTYNLDLTGWGWIHIVVGILLILTALALVTGATWARVTAIVLACLSIIANFLWIPYYPLWSILIIALDVVVIWAITTWSPERA